MDQNIAQVLALSVGDAREFFNQQPAIAGQLELLHQVGLDHLTLRRTTASLSGGERKRVKLAAQLDNPPSLLIMDKATSGSHVNDIRHLLSRLKQMVDGGSTVIMVEHNLDAMQTADGIIDLGSRPSNQGGQLIYNCDAVEIIKMNNGVTAKELTRYISAN